MSLIDGRVDSELSKESPHDQIQIILSVVVLFGREERQIKIASVVEDGSSSAVTTSQGNSRLRQVRQISFDPSVLMSADDDTRLVAPQQQNVLVCKVEILIEPIFQREVREYVGGLRDENGLDDVRVGRLLSGEVHLHRLADHSESRGERIHPEGGTRSEQCHFGYRNVSSGCWLR